MGCTCTIRRGLKKFFLVFASITIRSIEMVHKRFESFPKAFVDQLVSKQPKNLEMDLLSMPSNTGSLRLVQWPLFLLSSKVTLKSNNS
ncbi:putative 1,3-beta-glucan synthase [Helianthus annuus]|nr:putative 1,3-beta-glucan synthase [Helianthus annuus]